MEQPPEWQVEEILQRGRAHGKVHYLVKWKGYTPEESTWEPLENLTNCADLVRVFEATQKDTEKAKEQCRESTPALIDRVFEPPSSPPATTSAKSEAKHIEGVRVEQEQEPNNSRKNKHQVVKKDSKGSPKSKEEAEVRVGGGPTDEETSSSAKKRPVRRREARRMMVDSDDSSNRKSKTRGEPVKRFKPNKTEELVGTRGESQGRKTVKWAMELDSVVNNRPSLAELQSYQLEERPALPREPSSTGKLGVKEDPAEPAPVAADPPKRSEKKPEQAAVGEVQSRNKIDTASGVNSLPFYNRTRLERYQFCDAQLTRSRSTVLHSIIRREDKKSRRKELVKILDLSLESELVGELGSLAEAEAETELKVVVALVKVPYSWRVLGRRELGGPVVLTEVGMLGTGTWTTLVGMLA